MKAKMLLTLKTPLLKITQVRLFLTQLWKEPTIFWVTKKKKFGKNKTIIIPQNLYCSKKSPKNIFHNK